MSKEVFYVQDIVTQAKLFASHVEGRTIYDADVGNTDTIIAGQDANRLWTMIVNQGTGDVRVNFGKGLPATATTGLELKPGDSIRFSVSEPMGMSEIHAISEDATADRMVVIAGLLKEIEEE